MARIWIICGAILGATGVSIGAHHAHGLEKRLHEQGLSDEEVHKRMTDCETAVRYQMYHALALLAVGLLAARDRHRLTDITGVSFTLGVLGFSGGLYLIVFSGHIIHWAIIPGGGLLLIVGWIFLAISGFIAGLASQGAGCEK